MSQTSVGFLTADCFTLLLEWDRRVCLMAFMHSISYGFWNFYFCKSRFMMRWSWKGHRSRRRSPRWLLTSACRSPSTARISLKLISLLMPSVHKTGTPPSKQFPPRSEASNSTSFHRLDLWWSTKIASDYQLVWVLINRTELSLGLVWNFPSSKMMCLSQPAKKIKLSEGFIFCII